MHREYGSGRLYTLICKGGWYIKTRDCCTPLYKTQTSSTVTQAHCTVTLLFQLAPLIPQLHQLIHTQSQIMRIWGSFSDDSPFSLLTAVYLLYENAPLQNVKSHRKFFQITNKLWYLLTKVPTYYSSKN